MRDGLPAPQSKQAGELPPMTNSFSSTVGAAVPRFPDDDPIPPPLRRGQDGFTAPLPGPTAPRGDPHPLPPTPQGPLLSLPSPAEEAVFGPGREGSGEPPCPIQFRPGAGGGGGGLTSLPGRPGRRRSRCHRPLRVPGVTGAGRARHSHHHLRNLSGGSTSVLRRARIAPVSSARASEDFASEDFSPYRGLCAPRRRPEL